MRSDREVSIVRHREKVHLLLTGSSHIIFRGIVGGPFGAVKQTCLSLSGVRTMRSTLPARFPHRLRARRPGQWYGGTRIARFFVCV